MVPWSRSSRIQAPNAAGTEAASSPLPGISSSPSSRNLAIVAACGATPWPQIMSQRRFASLHTNIGASPSGPLVLGSTTCKVKPAAAAASNALPPFSSTLMPTAEASQCVEATTPNVPRISGRVVKPAIVSSPQCHILERQVRRRCPARERPAHRNRSEPPYLCRVAAAFGRAADSLPEVTSMPLDIPPDTTTTGEEFFRTEGAYTGLGAAISGGQIARWILGEGPQIDSDVELFDELCWRLLGDGVPLWRATLYMGTLHPLIRGVGVRWLRELKVIEDFRILHGSEETDEYLKSPIRATIERGTPFRRRLIEDTPEYPLLSKLRKAGATDYFALALNHAFRRFPVVTWSTDRPGGFGDA